jgi:O-antigen/teichoic acid export membrane protein
MSRVPRLPSERKHSRTSMGLVLANRCAGAALQVGVVVVVARLGSARTLGGYLAFSALVRLLGAAVSFGQPWYMLRSIAQADEVGDPARSRLVLWAGVRAVTRTFVVAAAVGVPIGLVVAARAGLGLEAFLLVLVATLTVGGYAYTDVGVDALKARSLTHWGVFLDFALTPLFVIAWAAIAVLLEAPSGILGLAVAHTAGTAVSAAASFILWRRDHRRRYGPGTGEAPLETIPAPGRGARRITFSFGLTSFLNVAAPSLPQVLLPLVMNLADVGRVGAALRLTSIPGVLGVGLSSVFAPRFARLAVNNDRRGLRDALRESQVWMTGLYFPFAIAFIVLPEQVVPVLGPEFGGTAMALRVLGIGQLVNAVTGLSPMLLTMCNTEMYVLVATAASAVVSGGASVAAGGAWGVLGAASGYAAAVSLRNALMYVKTIRVIRNGALVPSSTTMGSAVRGRRSVRDRA